MRGEAIRQRGHMLQMRRGGGKAFESSQQNDTEHYQPEVLMFAREQKLLHVTHHALGVTGRLDHSAPLRELRDAIRQHWIIAELPISGSPSN